MEHPRMEPAEKQNELHQELIQKRAYEKPAIIYSAPLEALAGACGTYPAGKTDPIICPNRPNRS
jgi:hypothetical protein